MPARHKTRDGRPHDIVSPTALEAAVREPRAHTRAQSARIRGAGVTDEAQP
jgi:hypothetical protein